MNYKSQVRAVLNPAFITLKLRLHSLALFLPLLEPKTERVDDATPLDDLLKSLESVGAKTPPRKRTARPAREWAKDGAAATPNLAEAWDKAKGKLAMDFPFELDMF